MNKEKTNKVLDYFEELFPDAHCELNHQNVFELLVAVMLSAQTTDKKVNQVTASLFKKYPTVESFALASLEDLQNDIKIIGLYRNKAKNLKKMAQVLLEEYKGEVPKTRKELESLPGVGRKTTNVVLSVGFDEPAFAVDTNVERISKRLGFAKKDDTVNDVERKVCRSIPRDKWNKAHHQFIFFGRYFCKAQNPNCKECHLYDMCKDKNVDILINNAGFGLFGLFTETDLDRELEMIDLNIKAYHILTKLFLKDFVEKDNGYILNVASSAGFMAGPRLSTYYATKNYVLKLTMAINEELRQSESHVVVSALCPGPVNTNFNKVAKGEFSIKEASPKFVAEYAIDKLFQKKMLIIPTLRIKLGIFLLRIIPYRLQLIYCYHIQGKKLGIKK